MKTIIKGAYGLFLLAIASAVCLLFSSFGEGGKKKGKDLRLVYWNIQNGMWSGQGENYDSFVNWVKEKNPDVCVWCEGETIYKTGTAEFMDAKERYLCNNWSELAKRYGHDYVYIGAHVDVYPQVITSKYPITNVKRIAGNGVDSVLVHGAGWATIEVNGKPINIVAIHTWPMQYTYKAKDKDASIAERGGDKYRRLEMEYIIKETIGSADKKGEQMWMMMGDFNSCSRVDNEKYKYPEDDTRFLVHDYIHENSPYIDIIKEKYPTEYKSSTGKGERIDFVYCTKPLYDCIKYADIITDSYTSPLRDSRGLSNFWYPSDHKPIVIDFNIK
jgi:endonuclease/exonuclease/phosphatase family metal-dependent hydrolase